MKTEDGEKDREFEELGKFLSITEVRASETKRWNHYSN